MQFRNSHLKVSGTNSIVISPSVFFCSVKHCIEFTNFVTISNFLKHFLYLLSRSKCSEITLFDSDFSVVRWEQKINCFWFITVILVVCYTLELFVWNVLSNCWTSEASVDVFFLSNYVSAIWSERPSKIFVSLDFFCAWLTVDASGCVPWIISLDVFDAVNVVGSWSLSLAQVLGLPQ